MDLIVTASKKANSSYKGHNALAVNPHNCNNATVEVSCLMTATPFKTQHWRSENVISPWHRVHHNHLAKVTSVS